VKYAAENRTLAEAVALKSTSSSEAEDDMNLFHG